jgi:hypothetical protein
VGDITGGQNTTPWGKESAIALDVLIAKLEALNTKPPLGAHIVTMYAPGKPPVVTTSDRLPPRRRIWLDRDTGIARIGFSGPTLNQHAEDIAKLPKQSRLRRIVELAEQRFIERDEIPTLERLADQIASAEESSMGQHDPQQQANENSNSSGAKNGPTDHLVLGVEFLGVLGGGVYILAAWSEHSDSWWMINIVVPCFVFLFAYLAYGVLRRIAKWNHSRSVLAAITAGLLLGIAFAIPYTDSTYGEMMPFVPIARKARFLLPIILTGFAAVSWRWAFIRPSQPSQSIQNPPPTTKPTVTAPSPPTTESTISAPASRPTTNPVAILGPLPPEIEPLTHAMFGEGPLDETDQWREITSNGELLVNRIKYLIRQPEPVSINARNLQLPEDFLHGTTKKLILVFRDGKKVTLKEGDDLTLENIFPKLPISKDNSGRTIRAQKHVGSWGSGAIFTEWGFYTDMRNRNPAITLEQCIELIEHHIAKGNFFVISK